MAADKDASDATILLKRVGAEAVSYRSFDAAPMPDEAGGGWKLLSAMSAPTRPTDPGAGAEPAAAEAVPDFVTEELPVDCTEAAVLDLDDRPPRPARRPARTRPVRAMAPEVAASPAESARQPKPFAKMFKRGSPDAAADSNGTDLATLFARLS